MDGAGHKVNYPLGSDNQGHKLKDSSSQILFKDPLPLQTGGELPCTHTVTPCSINTWSSEQAYLNFSDSEFPGFLII